MESSINNCLKQRLFSNHQVRTIHEDQEDQEVSSWIFYFEDIDHQDDEMIETKEDISHYYDNDSSKISDAASPIYTTNINNVVRRNANYNISTNHKKRRIIHQHKEEQKGEEEEEEDTASSPSNKTKEREWITEKKMNEQFTAELKKRGLCVVPLSMLSNFI